MTQDLSKLFLSEGDSIPVEGYRTLANAIRSHREQKHTVRIEFAGYLDCDAQTMRFRVIALDGGIEHRLYGTYAASHADMTQWINARLAYFGVAL